MIVTPANIAFFSILFLGLIIVVVLVAWKKDEDMG